VLFPDKNATYPNRTGCRETVNGSPIGALSQLRRIAIVEVEEEPRRVAACRSQAAGALISRSPARDLAAFDAD
jgi:hypothetical protein